LQQPGFSEEQTVFDTSPQVFLDLLGYVPLLHQLYGVVLPGAVAEELPARPGAPGSGVISLDWVANRTPNAESVRRVKWETPTVGNGAAEVIAPGLELACIVVLDERFRSFG
jgi:predicted nucleic acid-binding protein